MKTKYFNYIAFALVVIWIMYNLYEGNKYDDEIEKNGIETEITFEELSVFKLKEGLLNDRNKPFRLIEANEVKKQNEHKDWIAQAGVYFRHKKNENYYSFRKITYADGSVSGSTDFDIFTVNELNSKLHE